MLRSFLSCTCISPRLEGFLYFRRSSIFLQLIKQATLYCLQTGVICCKVLLHGNAVVGDQRLISFANCVTAGCHLLVGQKDYPGYALSASKADFFPSLVDSFNLASVFISFTYLDKAYRVKHQFKFVCAVCASELLCLTGTYLSHFVQHLYTTNF